MTVLPALEASHVSHDNVGAHGGWSPCVELDAAAHTHVGTCGQPLHARVFLAQRQWAFVRAARNVDHRGASGPSGRRCALQSGDRAAGRSALIGVIAGRRYENVRSRESHGRGDQDGSHIALARSPEEPTEDALDTLITSQVKSSQDKSYLNSNQVLRDFTWLKGEISHFF